MWCVGGDFNELLFSEDRNRPAASTSQMANFHAWVSAFNLSDLPLQYTHFTWSNFCSNAACSKLDRVFISPNWLDIFPAAALKGLPRPISGHCLLLLDTKDGPYPFRFENTWLSHKSFKCEVKSVWDQVPHRTWAGIRLQHKLKCLKHKS